MKDKISKEKITVDGKYNLLPTSLRGEILVDTVKTSLGYNIGYITATQTVCESQMIKDDNETQQEFQARLIKSGWLKHYNKFIAL